jgi:hypothetical protein
MSTPPPEADTKPDGLHQDDPPCTEDQPDKEASTVDDQDVLRKDSILADMKSDDVSPKADVEKDIDAGLERIDKAEEGKGSEPKISASQASPGSSTISGKGRKNTVTFQPLKIRIFFSTSRNTWCNVLEITFDTGTVCTGCGR